MLLVSDLTNLLITLTSAFFTAIAAVAAVMALRYTYKSVSMQQDSIKLQNDGLQLQREERKRDEPNLKVTANPTRQGTVQLAQIRVLNQSRTPVHLVGWLVMMNGHSKLSMATLPGALPYHGKFPVVLGEQEELMCLVQLPDDWRDIKRIGVQDISNRFWFVSDDGVKMFLGVANGETTFTFETPSNGGRHTSEKVTP